MLVAASLVPHERRAQASARVCCAAHDSMAGRSTSSRCSTQPSRVANLGSLMNSGRPMVVTSCSKWVSRPTWMMNHPSEAWNGSMMSGPRSPLRSPIDQKFVTMSVMATIASNIATSTCWPRPVRSRPRSAARMPIAAKSEVPMSPSAPAGLTAGGTPGSRRYS